jgi:hypothetical protein
MGQKATHRRGSVLVVAATTLAATAVVTATAAPRAAASSMGWTQLSPSTSPPARDSSAVAYDEATGQAVLFGGHSAQNGGVSFGDTWTWDGSQWTQQSPPISPPRRQDAGAAYDSSSGQVVMFGGYENGFLADTWVWNGQTWTQQHPAVSPPARDYMAMAYDPTLNGVVMFGGLTPSGPIGDAWLWAGGTWTPLNPVSSPQARYGASMVYDSVAQSLVMFGGLAPGDGALNDTWSFNGVAWTPINSATSPSRRSAQQMVFDTHLGASVLFGGALTQSSAFFGDTWQLSQGSWTQLSPGTSPSARANAATFYDPARCQMVVFGGSISGSTDVADTWTYGSCDQSGDASDDCAGPAAQTIGDGWIGDVYGRVRIFQPDPSTLWVCVRVDGEGLDTGGKLVVTFPTAAVPGSPAAGTDPQACTNEQGNTIPTAHPIESGSAGGGNLPAVAFLLDAFSNGQETWVCVEAGPVQDVLILDGVSATPPGVQYIPDPPGGHAPAEPAPTSPVSGSCATQPGATRLADMAMAGPSRLYAYLSRPAAGGIALCVRADLPLPAPSLGGVLTLNPAALLGSAPTAASYTPAGGPGSDPNCSQPVAGITNPQLAVYVSAPGVTQKPTICVYSSAGQPVGATLSAPSQSPPPTLTWTPDPDTPIPGFSR